jgi:hypothetical protein
LPRHRQKGLVDHNDPAVFSRLQERASATRTVVILRCSPRRGEPRRIGHKRSRPSFETPRKSAALRMTDECVDAQDAETNYPADFSYLNHKRKIPLTIANLVSHE